MALARSLFTGILLLAGAGLPPLPARAAQEATPQPLRLARFPSLSPDGKTIAFSWHGDLWTVPAEGGTARRLAALPGTDTRPKWSPDGKTLAFSSNRPGNNDIYTLPAAGLPEGGAPTRVTFHGADDIVSDWSPDGREILFSSSRESRSALLYTVRLEDGRLRRLTDDEVTLQLGAIAPDGSAVAYSRGPGSAWRRGYRGSASAEIYLLPLTGRDRAPRRLTSHPGQDFWPLFSADGRELYYVTDRDGTANVWRLRLSGRGLPAPGQPVTRHREGAVRYPSLSADRKTLVYEWDYGIWMLDLEKRGAGPRRVPILARDERPAPAPAPAARPFTGAATEFEVSPDGTRIALVVRGEIFLIPAAGGEATRLTQCPARDWDVVWSPDGRSLAYVCEQDANQNIHVLDVETRAERRVTSGTAPETSPRFSPDGKWLSYVRGPGARWLCVTPAQGGTERRERVAALGPNLGGVAWSPDSAWLAFTRRDLANSTDVWVTPLAEGGAPVNVSRHPGLNVQPEWSPDGQRLVFLSSRSGNMEIWRADLAEPGAAAPAAGALPRVRVHAPGLEKRARQLTNQPEAAKSFFILSPDGKSCLFPARVGGQSDLWAVSLDGGAPSRALPSVSGSIRLSGEGDKVL